MLEVYSLLTLKWSLKNNLLGRALWNISRRERLLGTIVLLSTIFIDGMSVIALLETCLIYIHCLLPFISQVSIQSDNVTTYQNGHLIVGIQLINIKMKDKFLVKQFTHSEIQHIKTILDAHFATANFHLKNFMLTYTQNRVTQIQTLLRLALL